MELQTLRRFLSCSLFKNLGSAGAFQPLAYDSKSCEHMVVSLRVSALQLSPWQDSTLCGKGSGRVQSLCVPNTPSLFQRASACFPAPVSVRRSEGKHSVAFAVIQLQMKSELNHTREKSQRNHT